MRLVYDERFSDSPYVERIWRTQSASEIGFTSLAFSNWFIVFWNQHGKNYVAIHGPETKVTRALVPEYADFLGIVFKHGTFMPQFPINPLINSEIALPDASTQSFWLHGSAWQFPDFDNIDTFVNRLVKQRIVLREPYVDAAFHGQVPNLSSRSLQRRILRTTGLTYNTIRQIDRARQAAILLQKGVSILDTVFQMGYSDQSHLTRAFKQYIGQTPSQMVDISNHDQLSFLFKTDDLRMNYDTQQSTVNFQGVIDA